MRPDVSKSPYGPLHAIAAGAVLLYLMIVGPIMRSGFSSFWHMFLYGVKMSADVKSTVLMLASTVAVFGGVALLAWLSTLFVRRKAGEARGQGLSARERREGLVLALKAALPITVATIVANMACSAAMEHLAGVKLADQSLVDFLRGGAAPAVKSVVAALVLFEAPLLEELVFRGVVFRGFARAMPACAAMLLSGFVFALVHVNAVTFIPLWFIGFAFAWLYAKTGTILAPMLVHFIFNLVNLCIAFLFPEM